MQQLVGSLLLCPALSHLDMHECSTPLDLNLIHRIMPNNTFEKKKFASVTIHVSDPNSTVLLFASGKMVLTGCHDFLNCILACHCVIDVLRRRLPGFFLEVRKQSSRRTIWIPILILTKISASQE
jgi:hypothetical protein